MRRSKVADGPMRLGHAHGEPVLLPRRADEQRAGLMATRSRLRTMLDYAAGRAAVSAAQPPTVCDMLRVIRAGGRMTAMEVALATGRSYDTVVHYITRLESCGVRQVEAAQRGSRKGVYLPPKYEYVEIDS